jgi:hypothetical protein
MPSAHGLEFCTNPIDSLAFARLSCLLPEVISRGTLCLNTSWHLASSAPIPYDMANLELKAPFWNSIVSASFSRLRDCGDVFSAGVKIIQPHRDTVLCRFIYI